MAGTSRYGRTRVVGPLLLACSLFLTGVSLRLDVSPSQAGDPSTDNIFAFVVGPNDIFEPARILSANTRAVKIVAGDFDNDGLLDLAAVGRQTATGQDRLFIWRNQGNAFPFPFPVTFSTQLTTPPVDLESADVDADGDTDLVVALQTGAVQRRTGQFATLQGTDNLPAPIRDLSVGNLETANTLPDYVAANGTNATLATLRRQPGGVVPGTCVAPFTPQVVEISPVNKLGAPGRELLLAGPGRLTKLDTDGTGACPAGSTVLDLINDGSGALLGPVGFFDVNQDGRLDVWALNRTTSALEIFHQQATPGTYGPRITVPLGLGPPGAVGAQAAFPVQDAAIYGGEGAPVRIAVVAAPPVGGAGAIGLFDMGGNLKSSEGIRCPPDQDQNPPRKVLGGYQRQGTLGLKFFFFVAFGACEPNNVFAPTVPSLTTTPTPNGTSTQAAIERMTREAEPPTTTPTPTRTRTPTPLVCPAGLAAGRVAGRGPSGECPTTTPSPAPPPPAASPTPTPSMTLTPAPSATGVAGPQLEIDKSGPPEPVPLFGELTYTITVRNTGTTPANGFLVLDPLPLDVRLLKPVQADAGFACQVESLGSLQNVSCLRTAPLAAGAQTHIVIRVQVESCPGVDGDPPLPTLFNVANLEGGRAALDTTVVNCNVPSRTPTVTPTPTVTLTPTPTRLPPGLTIAKSANPNPAALFGEITYTITVGNVGAAPANNFRVRDEFSFTTRWLETMLPDGGFTCQPPDLLDSLDCDRTVPLDPGQTARIVIRMRVESCATEAIAVNFVSIVGVGGPQVSLVVPINCLTPTRTATPTPIVAPPALTIAKSSHPNPVALQSVLTYTITVQNNGTTPVDGFRVDDLLPREVRWLETILPDGGFTCQNEFSNSPNLEFVDCTRTAPLAPGAQTRIIIRALLVSCDTGLPGVPRENLARIVSVALARARTEATNCPTPTPTLSPTPGPSPTPGVIPPGSAYLLRPSPPQLRWEGRPVFPGEDATRGRSLRPAGTVGTANDPAFLLVGFRVQPNGALGVSDLLLLPPGTTQYDFSPLAGQGAAPGPFNPLTCYVLFPVEGDPPNVLGISDFLCGETQVSPGPPPVAFSIQLNDSPIARLAWQPPGTTPQGRDSVGPAGAVGGYRLLAVPLTGDPVETIDVGPGTLSTTHDTVGHPTCYTLLALPAAPEAAPGVSSLACGAPGISTLGRAGRPASFSAQLEELRQFFERPPGRHP